MELSSDHSLSLKPNPDDEHRLSSQPTPEEAPSKKRLVFFFFFYFAFFKQKKKKNFSFGSFVLFFLPKTTPPPFFCRKVVQKTVVTVKIGSKKAAIGIGKVKNEGPPPDFWSWRKYGQKPIKGSPYPRF